jgi:hypothetical protein
VPPRPDAAVGAEAAASPLSFSPLAETRFLVRTGALRVVAPPAPPPPRCDDAPPSGLELLNDLDRLRGGRAATVVLSRAEGSGDGGRGEAPHALMSPPSSRGEAAGAAAGVVVKLGRRTSGRLALLARGGCFLVFEPPLRVPERARAEAAGVRDDFVGEVAEGDRLFVSKSVHFVGDDAGDGARGSSIFRRW